MAGQIGADEDQTSPVVNEDDLLPIVLRANPSFPNYWYQLVYPNTMQIYLDRQKTTPVTWFFSSGEDTELFVEAKSLMIANEITFDFISMNLVDEFQSYVVAYDVDEIRVNRFMLEGPTSVPNGSRYIYKVSGVDPAVSNFSSQPDGTLTTVHWSNASTFTNWQEEVFDFGEDGEERMAKVGYVLPNAYSWGLDVAIVKIELQDAWEDGDDLTYSTSTERGRNEYYQATSADRMVFPIAQRALDSEAPGSDRAMMAISKVVITGPVKNGRVRGVGEIEVGFVQNLRVLKNEATFEGGVVHERDFPMDSPYLDTSAVGSTWAGINGQHDFFQDDEVDFPSRVVYDVPVGGIAQQTRFIDFGDAPSGEITDVWIDSATQNRVISNSGEYMLSLYVAARSNQSNVIPTDIVPYSFVQVLAELHPESAINPNKYFPTYLNSTELYFQMGKADWYFNFDVNIPAAGAFSWTKTMSPAVLRGDESFAQVGNAILVPVTTGVPFNNAIAGAGWRAR